MSVARERVLQSLRSILLNDGAAGATLERVAHHAGVSKGGLLYHFASKEALFEALLDQLRATATHEADRLRELGAGAVEAFLRGSTASDDQFTADLLVVLGLVGAPEVDALGAVRDALDECGRAVAEQVDDPVTARAVQLLGDGLYLHAVLGTTQAALDRDVVTRFLGLLIPSSGE